MSVERNELFDMLYDMFYSYNDAIMSIPNHNHNQVQNRSLYDRNPIKRVITDEEREKLVPIKYKDIENKEQNSACLITQEEFSDEDDVLQLPCMHCFNPDAIIRWLTEESCFCPVCRYEFESVEKRFEQVDQETMNNNILVSNNINNNNYYVLDIPITNVTTNYIEYNDYIYLNYGDA